MQLAPRLQGLYKTIVWHEFSPLAIQYKSVHFGQGLTDSSTYLRSDTMKQAIYPIYGRYANQYARSYAHTLHCVPMGYEQIRCHGCIR